MSILKPILVITGLTFLVWIIIGFLRALLLISLKQSSGVGLVIPRFLRGIPPAWQVFVTLFGIPLLIGIVGGCIWKYCLHR
jgi:hypothetical protein